DHERPETRDQELLETEDQELKKRGIRIALKGGHEFYQRGYSKRENFHTGARLFMATCLLKSLFISITSEICSAHLAEHIFMIVIYRTKCNSNLEEFYKIF
uniref:hypothetical protein n=1 Tax=Succinimonas sp. TaxID=1936151 RepID=UPI00386FB40B